MKKEIAVIVVTYNRLPLLQECISAIRQQTLDKFQIIVVNNGSTDGTSDWLSAQDDLIVINQKNCGGAGGFYTGLKYSAEHGFTYSWLMDDDTVPTSAALEKLYAAITEVPDFGFLSSKVIDIEGSPCNYPGIDYRRNNKGQSEWLKKSDAGLLKISSATFVSFFVNNKTVESVGLPYKEFFIWGDDTEYSTRISKAHDCYLVLNSIVQHKYKLILSQRGPSIFTEKDKTRVKMYFYSYRNNIFLRRKQQGLKSTISLVWKIAGLLYDALRLLLHGNVYKCHLLLKGVFAGLVFSPKIEYPCRPEKLSS